MQESSVPVLIAGGGPWGLMLANELGRRGVGAMLVDEKPSTAFNPQANATQARTMEHFGFEWTLLRLRRHSPVAEDIAKAARSFGIDLAVVDVDRNDARDLYEADVALIRPDQIVAWRGTARCEALQVVAQASGRGRAASTTCLRGDLAS